MVCHAKGKERRAGVSKAGGRQGTSSYFLKIVQAIRKQSQKVLKRKDAVHYADLK